MFSQNALAVLKRRYLIKDADGNPAETPEDMLRRVAATIASADVIWDPKADISVLADTFFEMMNGKRFMPNSPTLMNAGRPLGQLSACFVLPVDDSMEGIFDAVKNAAIIHQSGGGTGFSFSRLRPAGSTVRSTGGVASGPVSFMKVFNAATEAIKQGGTRRGANMGMLRIDHPDILDFIKCKDDLTQLTNFNISVALTDTFMKAVTDGKSYDLIDPHTKTAVRSLSARDVFSEIVSHAWRTGEPGIVFIDRINAASTVPNLGRIESTNPCGEQPLLPFESCNLGSVNLSAFVRDGGIDWASLKETVFSAVHFLDNVIEINKYPLTEIREKTLQSRKIGLGVMGFADLLIRAGVPYGSQESLDLAEEIASSIDRWAKEKSAALAEKRGNFPAWAESVYGRSKQPMRNATVTTVAPTGTISIICGASSGIEPVFALSYIRNIMDNTEMVEGHEGFQHVLRERNLYTDDLMRRVALAGSIQGISEIPEDIRRVFVTAHDVTPEMHIRMQAVFQRHTDNAVSKTVNLPHDATIKDVETCYDLAWKLGLKGVTIYRDGSRESQVLNIGSVNRPKEETPVSAEPSPGITPRTRPDVTQGITEKVRIGCGNLYITVNYDDQGICEVFTNLGRAGGCPSQSEATSRLISVALRGGMSVEELVDQLRGIRCHATRGKHLKVLSCPDAIGRAIEKVNALRHEDVAPLTQSGAPPESGAVCPECGAPLEHEGGCNICQSCGYSKCG